MSETLGAVRVLPEWQATTEGRRMSEAPHVDTVGVLPESRATAEEGDR
ncbi:hypothetical protein ACIA5D_11875 [Actinoplanes sp. NPDC051513]